MKSEIRLCTDKEARAQPGVFGIVYHIQEGIVLCGGRGGMFVEHIPSSVLPILLNTLSFTMELMEGRINTGTILQSGCQNIPFKKFMLWILSKINHVLAR